MASSVARGRILVTLLVVSLLHGCVSAPKPTEPSPPVVVEERVILDEDVATPPEDRRIGAEPLPQATPVSPVVQTLLASANNHANQGNSEAAAASLERALRIEPRNALLWSKLASVRYSQQNWQQAIQLAAKSNTLSGTDQGLRRQNWYLIGNAYEAMGNAIMAERYRRKLRPLD